MNRDARIFVAGHRGMVGSAIVRRLRQDGHENLVVRTREELDLRDAGAVREFFEQDRPEYVFLAAAHVGGILANDTSPVEFLRDNLALELAVIDAAHHAHVTKLLFLGSSCVYPKFAAQPIHEDSLLTGSLEPTNEWYAIAKIAGIKLCQAYRKQHGADFISAMPTNLYGPNDNFNLERSHVVPALMRKLHDARAAGRAHVGLWGSGTPRREFLHVDDLADACVFLMHAYSDALPVNVGTGTDITIRELAELLKEITGFDGELVYDSSKPDGTPQKLLDVSRLSSIGWKAQIALRDGLRSTYEWYIENSVAGPVSRA